MRHAMIGLWPDVVTAKEFAGADCCVGDRASALA
ncbi:MAG: hypothetical protein ACJAU6_000605 [Alphaproteobacteria bacterium]|jgi:hypothetical protein